MTVQMATPGILTATKTRQLAGAIIAAWGWLLESEKVAG